MNIDADDHHDHKDNIKNRGKSIRCTDLTFIADITIIPDQTVEPSALAIIQHFDKTRHINHG